MLILTRKKGEAIFIGDNIELCVDKIAGEPDNRHARITLRMPKETLVLRKKILDEIAAEKALAAEEGREPRDILGALRTKFATVGDGQKGHERTELKLRMKLEEYLSIEGFITIKITEFNEFLDSSTVSIGIAAPPHVPLHRSEVRRDIERHGQRREHLQHPTA